MASARTTYPDTQGGEGRAAVARPFVWVTAYTWVTPKATNSRIVRQITGGWMWGGLLRYASGSLIWVRNSVSVG